MPIRISSELPAFKTLGEENIFVMSKERAEHQDIRPLKVIIVNIMPKKIDTENQLMRLLSNTPLQVDIDLLQMASHVSRNTSRHHLDAFYKTFDEVRNNRYDGMIITGAPVELLDFEQVDYWNEITEIMEWSKTHIFSTIHICWAAQAGLYYHYGIPKYQLPHKMFGIFPHRMEVSNSQLLRGFDDIFYVPHSRNTEVRREDIERIFRESTLLPTRTAGSTLSRDTQSTTGKRLRTNTSAIWKRVSTFSSRTTISPMTIPTMYRCSRGDVRQILCSQTGSITAFTRKLPIILRSLRCATGTGKRACNQ